MCVILLESSDSDETAEGTRNLITMKHTEICVPQWQVTITVNTVLEQNTVGRTVHGFQAKTGTFGLEKEHILLVLLIMARLLPEIQIEDIWCDDLLIAASSVLITAQSNQLVVNMRTGRVPKSTAWSNAKVGE
jgi:hypothetical protein